MQQNDLRWQAAGSCFVSLVSSLLPNPSFDLKGPAPGWKQHKTDRPLRESPALAFLHRARG